MIAKGTKKLTAKDWDEILARFHQSGLSCAAFAAREGLSRSRLHYRLQCAKASLNSSPGEPFATFVEVPRPLAPLSPPVLASPAALSIPQPLPLALPGPCTQQAPICALRLQIGTLCLEFGALPAPDYVLSLARGLSC